MAVKFFNIKSGEIRVAEIEPHITAMWACSDRSPNITQGQDLGWRLAPEVVVEIKKLTQDPNQLVQIASRIGKPLEDVTEPDVLSYISSRSSIENAPVASQEDYADTYNNEIRRQLEEAENEKAFSDAENGIVAPKESLEDLRARVELEERLAAARATTATATTTETPATTTKAVGEKTKTTSK